MSDTSGVCAAPQALSERFRAGAKKFVAEANGLASLREIAWAMPNPDDEHAFLSLDLGIMLSGTSDLKNLAKAARQLSSYWQDWQVYVFDEVRGYLGRICRNRTCPAESRSCAARGCGAQPFLRLDIDGELKEMRFFSSPLEILWSAYPESGFLAYQQNLNRPEPGSKPKPRTAARKCRRCGREYQFPTRLKMMRALRRDVRLQCCPACRKLYARGEISLDEEAPTD